MRRYILKCAILSTYGQSNNNYKPFRSKLGSNTFIWYITTINKILRAPENTSMIGTRAPVNSTTIEIDSTNDLHTRMTGETAVTYSGIHIIVE